VATYLGVLAAFSWQAGLIFAVVWLAIAFAARYSSLAALTAAIVSPIALYMLGQPQHAAVLAIMSVIVFFTHRANISRLLARNETKIGQKG